MFMINFNYAFLKNFEEFPGYSSKHTIKSTYLALGKNLIAFLLEFYEIF